jgi:hypothetical protein
MREPVQRLLAGLTCGRSISAPGRARRESLARYTNTSAPSRDIESSARDGPQEGLVVVDLERDEVALGGDPLLPRCMRHPYVSRLTARLRRVWFCRVLE